MLMSTDGISVGMAGPVDDRHAEGIADNSSGTYTGRAGAKLRLVRVGA